MIESGPSLHPLIEFPSPVSVTIKSASWMFGAQCVCSSKKAATSAPTASLRTEPSLRFFGTKVSTSGNILPVVIPRGGNSRLRARTLQIISYFNSHQRHRQSWVVPLTFLECGIWMVPLLWPIPIVAHHLPSFLAVALTLQLATGQTTRSLS